MATIKKRGNSYLIRCSDGYDINGKHIEKSMTWKIPPGMSDKRAEKEAMRLATLFEEQVRNGQIAENHHVKFSDFVDKWFKEYAETNLKARSIDGYKRLMGRILPVFGHMYIDKIRPAHLSAFYSELFNTNKEPTYKCNIDIKGELNRIGKSMAKFSNDNQIHLHAVKSAACGRNITLNNAQDICNALNMKLEHTFTAVESETLSSSTVNKYHRVLSSIFSTAVQWGVVVSNPCDRVSPPKIQNRIKESDKFLSVDEAVRMISLLESEPRNYKNAIVTLLFTGMRRGELLALEWGDYDEESMILKINKSIQYLPDKGIFEDSTKNESSYRTIKIPGSVALILDDQKKWQSEQAAALQNKWENTGKIFTGVNGGYMHPDTLSGWFKSFIKRNGLPDIHLHSLRHTNATLQISNGSAVTTVAGYLGHANAGTTTKIYAHAIQEAQARSAEILDNLLKKDA